MRRASNTLGVSLCIGTVLACAAMHVATFLTLIPPLWVLVVFFPMMGAVLCARAAESGQFLKPRASNLMLCGCALLVYAVITLVYIYKTTGGASSVGVVDGQYFSEYKGQVIRSITEYEYKIFPTLWTRVLSAWIAMMSVFCLRSFAPTVRRGGRMQ